jgi:hypothetical protein
MKTFILPTLAGLASTLSPQPRVYTAADYERAEKSLAGNTNPLVFHSGVRATWLADERFQYRVTTPESSEFILVDTAKGTRAPAFDHGKLAAGLSTAAAGKYDANHLPFTEVDPSADVRFRALSRAYDRAGVPLCDRHGGLHAVSGYLRGLCPSTESESARLSTAFRRRWRIWKIRLIAPGIS